MKARGRSLAFGAALLAAQLALGAGPAHALRVVTWNLLQYPDYNLAGRQPSFRTVMANINADVLIAQELLSQAGVDSFQTNVLNVVEPGQWTNSGYAALQTSPVPEGGTIFWKPAKVNVSFVSQLVTGGPRNVLFGRVTPVGYTNLAGTFRVYSVHFKAGGPSTTDSTTRRLEATSLRNQLNNVPANTNFLVGGDTNLYGAYEGAYIRLTESQSDNDGRGFDLLSMPGDWHTIPSYAAYYSQCPCNTGCPAGISGGGLDDRFDLFLGSATMVNGQGVDMVSSGYFAYGNDGLHFNSDVNGGGFNNAVGLTIANALWTASDHLPVVCTVQLASRIQAASLVDFGSAIQGSTASKTLTVTNSAPAPADNLDYSFSAPAGFTVPSGSFSAAAGAGNDHTLGISTASTGVKSGTLTVTTDAPDSLSKPVQLSGKVVTHAVSSLDPTAIVTEDSLDFGAHDLGAFSDHARLVYNFGYNSLQAALAVNGASFTGDARFSITGGFTPSLVTDMGQSYSIHFDDSGATGGTTYTGTLTFTSADEPIPGSSARADLVVHLKATVNSTTGVLPGPLPAVLAFLPPRPNPVGTSTRFAFDLPNAAGVTLDVFDLGGRRLARVVDGEQSAGRHEISWNALDDQGRRLSAGLYFVRFTTLGLTQTRRVAILP